MTRTIDRLIVSSGEVYQAIEHPSVRAVIPGNGHRGGVLRFRYDGRTKKLVPLASGQYREQAGIKLLAGMPGQPTADDAVYALWRWAPDRPRIWATTKIAGEYHPPTAIYYERQVGAPVIGQRYELVAQLDGLVLRIWLEHEIMWVGELAAATEVMPRTNATGLRTDNAALSELELKIVAVT